MEISSNKFLGKKISQELAESLKKTRKKILEEKIERIENLFCAHVVIWMKYKDGVQNEYPIWENVYLVKANTEDEAWEKAEKKGREECEDDDGLEVDGRPARWTYGGVRKLISVIDISFFECKIHESMEDIIELTWSEFTVLDKISLDKLIAGESVIINYDE